MAGERGERTVNGHLCLRALNWAFRSGLHQYATSKPPGRGLERHVHAACLFSVCVYVCGSLLICVPSESCPFEPLCVKRGETRAPSRHEITDYTLNASPRGLHRAQESRIESKWEGRNKGTEWGRWERNTNKRFEGLKRQTSVRKLRLHGRKQLLKRMQRWPWTGRTGCEKERKRKWGWMLLCFSYRDGWAVLLPAALQCAAEGLVLHWWP